MNWVRNICNTLHASWMGKPHSKFKSLQRQRRKLIKPDSHLESRVMLISFVDANNDGVFNGADVELNQGELDDGVFDTTIAEGNYTTVIAGAGLVIGDDLNLKQDGNFAASGVITILAEIKSKKNLQIISITNSINLDGALFKVKGNLQLRAATAVNSQPNVIFEVGERVAIQAINNIDLSSNTVSRKGGAVGLFEVRSQTGTVDMQLINITGKLRLIANATALDVNLSDSSIVLTNKKNTEVAISAKRNLLMDNAVIQDVQRIFLFANGNIVMNGGNIKQISKEFTTQLLSEGNIDLDNTRIRATALLVRTTAAAGNNFLTNASLGITKKSKEGIIIIEATSNVVQNAEIVAPIFPTINGTQTGTPAFIGVGFLD